MNAGAAAVFWPVYWPARWSMQFWAPSVPVTVTNTVYVTNTVERPGYGSWPIPHYQIPINYPWQEYKYQPGDPVIGWNTNGTLGYITNFVSTNYIKFYTNGSNITYVH